jgi:hypothetical protein
MANGAYAFDGIDDVISYAHLASLDGATAFTVSTWIYVDSSTSGTFGFYLDMIDRSGAEQGVAVAHWTFSGQPLTEFAAISSNSGSSVDNRGTLTADAWNHLWWAYDGTQTITNRNYILINGSGGTGGTAPAAIGSGAELLRLGNSADNFPILCQLADVGILFGRSVRDGTGALCAAGMSIGNYVTTGDFWASFRVNANDENGGRAATVSGAVLSTGPSLTFPGGGTTQTHFFMMMGVGG